jgi:hypothetical protein
MSYVHEIQINGLGMSMKVYHFNDILVDFAVTTKPLTAGPVSIYGCTQTGFYQFHKTDSKRLEPVEELETKHIKDPISMVSGFNMVITYSPDGKIVVRNEYDINTSYELQAHESYLGGVIGVSFMRGGYEFLTFGGDGVVKIWKWSNAQVIGKGVKDAHTLLHKIKEATMSVDMVTQQHHELVFSLSLSFPWNDI